MERWEYLTRFIYADIRRPGAQEFFQAHWPGTQPAQYAPQTMIPELDELGVHGWELVQMQPVAQVGVNEDIRFQGESGTWSNAYFCVFKRRIPEQAERTPRGAPGFPEITDTLPK